MAPSVQEGKPQEHNFSISLFASRKLEEHNFWTLLLLRIPCEDQPEVVHHSHNIQEPHEPPYNDVQECADAQLHEQSYNLQNLHIER